MASQADDCNISEAMEVVSEYSKLFMWDLFQEQPCSQSSSSSSTEGDMDFFDSLASSVDLDEAAKRYVLAEKFHLIHYNSFQGFSIPGLYKLY